MANLATAPERRSKDMHCFQSDVPCCQFPDTRLKPSTTDLSDLQPTATQDPADAQFNVEKLALQQLASNKKGSGILASHRFGMNRAVPPHPQQLGDPACIFPVGLHRHRRERRLHMPCPEQNRIAPGGHKPGTQRLRQCPSLEPNAADRQSSSSK